MGNRTTRQQSATKSTIKPTVKQIRETEPDVYEALQKQAANWLVKNGNFNPTDPQIVPKIQIARIQVDCISARLRALNPTTVNENQRFPDGIPPIQVATQADASALGGIRAIRGKKRPYPAGGQK